MKNKLVFPLLAIALGSTMLAIHSCKRERSTVNEENPEPLYVTPVTPSTSDLNYVNDQMSYMAYAFCQLFNNPNEALNVDFSKKWKQLMLLCH